MKATRWMAAVGAVLAAAMTAAGAEAEGTAAAETAKAGSWVAVGPKIGTLGYGGEATVRVVSEYLNARVGFNMFAYDREIDMDEATVNADLNWQTIPILLDAHPFGGGFRVSAGIVLNDNGIDLAAVPNLPIELNGVTYQPEDFVTLTGRVGFDETSYYVGIGYGNAVAGGRVHFSCDFGVMFHGEPAVELNVEPSAALPPAVADQLRSDVESERAEFEEDLSEFAFYPVISMGFTVNF